MMKPVRPRVVLVAAALALMAALAGGTLLPAVAPTPTAHASAKVAPTGADSKYASKVRPSKAHITTKHRQRRCFVVMSYISLGLCIAE